jgi:hypothetical protein
MTVLYIYYSADLRKTLYYGIFNYQYCANADVTQCRLSQRRGGGDTTSGGRSVGIVRSPTKATEFSFSRHSWSPGRDVNPAFREYEAGVLPIILGFQY